jgi:lipopolysaccharide/colanic/teichoic acid biosynthesis glycosyltransferase
MKSYRSKAPGDPRHPSPLTASYGPVLTCERVEVVVAGGQGGLGQEARPEPVLREEAIHLFASSENPAQESDLVFYLVGQSPAKRVLDVVLCVFGVVLTAPLWALISLAIKLEDGGPILYSQERWGKGGHTFTLHKFRSMVTDSDAMFGVRQAILGDERVTTVGRFLRSTGLDELPQLFNIIAGDMSLVGPRALAFAEVLTNDSGELLTYETIPGFAKRLSIRPGLTGPATVYLDKDANPIAKFEQDLLYVDQQSLTLDLRLIALSIWISLRGKWEDRGRKL